MIELVQSAVIARQMRETLTGKTIAEAAAGQAPHKFAFHDRDFSEYPAILQGRTVGEAHANGNVILLPVEPGYVLGLGMGGERITFHEPGAKLPSKLQLWLRFTDESQLTVTVQGWGAVYLKTAEDALAHQYMGAKGISPLDDGFTPEYWLSMFETLSPDAKTSVKYFIVSDPQVHGMGNGCLQDVLWAAGVHPKRRAASLDEDERMVLYDALRGLLQDMVDEGGRDSELDLFGHKGGYERILHSKTVGLPCPACQTPIEKASYLGGTVYYCPSCQPED